jgi:hypothetical protein
MQSESDLPDLSDALEASRFQTCLHEAAHALLVLLCGELTLKDPAIVDGPTPDHVALTCTTAVKQFVPSTQKHRDVVRISLGGSIAEQRLDSLTRGSDEYVPANPIHWQDDLEMMMTHLKDGGLYAELESLTEQAQQQVEEHWGFIVALAKFAMQSLPKPVSRGSVLDIAVAHKVLRLAKHP